MDSCGSDLRSFYFPLAFRAVKTDIDRAATLFVDDVAQVRSFSKTLAPRAQREHDGSERPTLFGQHVLVTIRVSLIALSFQDAGLGEFVQPGGQDVVCDARRFEILKPSSTQDCVADDEQRPPLPHNVERSGNRAR